MMSGFPLGSYVRLVDYTGRLFRLGKARISAEAGRNLRPSWEQCPNLANPNGEAAKGPVAGPILCHQPGEVARDRRPFQRAICGQSREMSCPMNGFRVTDRIVASAAMEPAAHWNQCGSSTISRPGSYQNPPGPPRRRIESARPGRGRLEPRFRCRMTCPGCVRSPRGRECQRVGLRLHCMSLPSDRLMSASADALADCSGTRVYGCLNS